MRVEGRREFVGKASKSETGERQQGARSSPTARPAFPATGVSRTGGGCSQGGSLARLKEGVGSEQVTPLF